MENVKNNVTANVALSSRITICFCDVIVTQNAVKAMNISNMIMTLKDR